MRIGSWARAGTGLCLAAALLLGLLPVPQHAVQAVDGAIVVLAAPRVLAADISDQGVAVSDEPSGQLLTTRGSSSIPDRLSDAGWTHIGDPDALGSAVVDAYQGSAGTDLKLFTITYPDGSSVQLVHRLVPGEQYHNSFVAVSPDRRFLVAGEWGKQARLLVFTLPTHLVPGARIALPLTGIVVLSHAMRDVQGCDFDTSTELICSTNDPRTDLYQTDRQILAVHLDHPVRAGINFARPTLVATVPQQTLCPNQPGEVEGIDVSAGVVRVIVNASCDDVSELFTLRLPQAQRGGVDVDTIPSWASAPPLIAATEPERRRRRI